MKVLGRKTCECGQVYSSELDTCPQCKAPEWSSDFTSFNALDWVYDFETYPNIITCAFIHVATNSRVVFEMSDRKNEVNEFLAFLKILKESKCRMVGFGNLNFDYPILHYILTSITSVTLIYNKAQSIIDSDYNDRSHMIWDNKILIQQIDLLKIHHFDNSSRLTSLKLLEFNMRMDNIQDLPFAPGSILSDEEKDTLIEYNFHDCVATRLFYIESIEMIETREKLGEEYGMNFLNHSDKKIGTDIFVDTLESATPGICYDHSTGRKEKRQTIRESIKLADVIFPYIKFKTPEFETIKNWLAEQTIENFDEKYLNVKGVFKQLIATVNGFNYKFGSGGIHASIDSAIVCSDDEYIIVDWDVGGYYPELGTANNLYPEHLSERFCDANKKLASERKKHKKGTALNNSFKLARNGAYGDSNNKYSPLYDPQYTMAITINGQLLLCLLAENLIEVPGLQMIQCNTDGLTVRCPRIYEQQMNDICKWWDSFTCLSLESAVYKRMFIRDVNNYIAEYENGDTKAKGAYVYQTKQSQGLSWTPNDMDWHQNYNALVIPKAAHAFLLHGQCVDDFIHNHADVHDFMLRTKINKSCKLMFKNLFGDEYEVQRTTRYYISRCAASGVLTKISQPANGKTVGGWARKSKLTDEFYISVIRDLHARRHLFRATDDLDADGYPWDSRINTKNRSKYKIRNDKLNTNCMMSLCNDINDANREDIDFEWYIEEAKKLINPLLEIKI